MNRFFLCISFPFIFLVARAGMMVLHELSHAVAVLLMTRGDVAVHLGFYEPPDRCPRVRVGRLTVLFTTNPLRWRRGCCIQEDYHVSFFRMAVIAVAGALGNAMIAILLFYCAFVLELNDLLLWLFLVMMGFSLWGLRI